MRTSQNGINLIKQFEGCRLTAYKCPAGVWTIGYGHTAGVKEGQKITQAQADTYLKEDLKVYEKHVNNLQLPINQNQFDALVSFCYNCGPGNLKKLVKNRTLSQIADTLLLYNRGGGVVLKGLVRRRNAERELFLKGSSEEYKVTATALNIRSGAGVKNKVIGYLKNGDIVNISTIQNGWGKLSDKNGWVSMAYLRKI